MMPSREPHDSASGGSVTARAMVIMGAALLLSSAPHAAIADETVAVGSFPTPVNPQVTDVLTSPAGFVNGGAPAIALGRTSLSMALSVGPAYNAAPGTVAHAVTLDDDEIASLLRSASSTQSDEATGQIGAIADLAEDCGNRCVVNVHVHVERSAMLTPDQREAALAAATALAEAWEAESGDEVTAIGWIVPDGDGHDAESDTEVTRIDILLQRDLDTNDGTPTVANPDGCALRPYATCPGVSLDGLDLAGLDLTGIDLTGASLEGTRLDRADLSWSSLVGAYLPRASLVRADLRYASLRDSWLARADFAGANLQRADLSGAETSSKSFAAGTDLSNAIWSNGVRCIPGSIGVCRQP